MVRIARSRLASFMSRATLIAVMVWSAAKASAEDSTTAKPRPLTRTAIETLVSTHLRENALYLPGDLISQSDVEPIFNALIAAGHGSPDIEGLYDSFLPDRDPFVKTMRTPQGRMFMRSVAKLPGAYDRLERLSWSAAGRALLVDLISSADGKKAFEHMLTEDGLKVVETMLAKDPRGENFRLPTGKVHTANELIDHLCEMYEVEAAK